MDGWTDSGGTCVDVIRPSVTLRERERERERERAKGGGESSREAVGWGLEV